MLKQEGAITPRTVGGLDYGPEAQRHALDLGHGANCRHAVPVARLPVFHHIARGAETRATVDKKLILYMW